jgi:hypothetical protein
VKTSVQHVPPFSKVIHTIVFARQSFRAEKFGQHLIKFEQALTSFDFHISMCSFNEIPNVLQLFLLAYQNDEVIFNTLHTPLKKPSKSPHH